MTARLDRVGVALGHPTRTVMLDRLLDGRAWTPSELALAAEVTRPTASHHLEVLENSGLVTMVRSGRHRYVRLASDEVAGWLEAGAALAPRPRRPDPQPGTFEHARLCWDHLAGRVGVELSDRLLAAGWIREEGEQFTVADPAAWEALGVDLKGRRMPIRRCLDATERRFHVGGAVGAAIAGRLLAEGGAVRVRGGRAVRITDIGRTFLARLGT